MDNGYACCETGKEMTAGCMHDRCKGPRKCKRKRKKIKEECSDENY